MKQLPITFLLTIFLVGVLGLGLHYTVNDVFAQDKCKGISDLDKKAECYDKEYESTTKRLADVRAQKSDVTNRISQLATQLNVTQQEINALQGEITSMGEVLAQINVSLEEKREQLAEKVAFRNQVIRNHTKRATYQDLDLFFSLAQAHPSNLGGFQFTAFQQVFGRSVNTETHRVIGVINAEIDNFEADKAEAEKLKQELETAQANLIAARNNLSYQQTQAQQSLGSLADAEKTFQQRLSEISKKQQEVLTLKAGLESGTVGDYVAPQWKVPDPPFSPAFGFFSYGAYTHYRGMSQYGAKARAEAGQSANDIIKHYYKQETTKPDDFPSKVKVEGYGELDFQYYLYGLAEMPDTWPMEALKAQAIAGRTYAYRYVKAGKEICTSQSCQVFLKSKADNVPAKWKQAVDETKGRIISGDTHAMYSSTTGGYLDDSGWDVKSGTNWPQGAYENLAKSPWFYWAWYSKTMRFDSDTCGRNYPWLNNQEMADILNSWVVWKNGSSSERSRISPVTTSCWGGDPYSMSEMADKAASLDKKFTTVTGATAAIGENGRTQTLAFNTDQGILTVDAQEFRTVFNLRAPAYVALKSRLYDIQVIR